MPGAYRFVSLQELAQAGKLRREWTTHTGRTYVKDFSQDYYKVKELLRNLPVDQRELYLRMYVEDLARKYPRYQFRYQIRRYNGYRFFIIRRGSIQDSGRYKEIPIYIDLLSGEIFVPRSYLRKQPKLVIAVIHYRISGLLAFLRAKFPAVAPEPQRPGRKHEGKAEKKKAVSKTVICPKCGRPGTLTKRWVISGDGKKRYYWYVGHKKNGKIKWCYIGKYLPPSLAKVAKELGLK